MFKNWNISHLSNQSASEIFRALSAPESLIKSFDQLNQKCVIPMTKVDPETYKKTHLSQLSRNEFCDLFALGPCPTRVSMRTKQPTQKFQDSPCSSSMPNLGMQRLIYYFFRSSFSLILTSILVSSMINTSPPNTALNSEKLSKVLNHPIRALSERKPNLRLDKARQTLKTEMKHRKRVRPKYR